MLAVASWGILLALTDKEMFDLIRDSTMTHTTDDLRAIVSERLASRAASAVGQVAHTGRPSRRFVSLVRCHDKLLHCGVVIVLSQLDQ